MKPKAKEIGFLVQNPLPYQQQSGAMFGQYPPVPPSSFYFGAQQSLQPPPSQARPDQNPVQNFNLFGMVDQAQKMLTNVQKVKPLLQQLNSMFPFSRAVTVTCQRNDVLHDKPIRSRYNQRNVRIR